MKELRETIIACITGRDKAAVAVIRLSGEDAFPIARKVFQGLPEQIKSHQCYYGKFVHGDDGLATTFTDGRGYTGEDSVEFSIHGSPASVQGLLDACIKEGARLAEPGEFTYRAFMNGKIDLSQAEGVRETVEAETSAQLRQAKHLQGGLLPQKIQSLVDLILKEISAVEASVDFSEEIGDYDRVSGLQTLSKVIQELENLCQTAKINTLIANGARIAIMGQPNAGKSSLLNAIVGKNRAIVTPIPGTTRDHIEVACDLDSFKTVLIDTAGLRETTDEVETIGIANAYEIASQSDWILYVYDSQTGWTRQDEAYYQKLQELAGLNITIVANKSDLAHSEHHLNVSAKQQTGIAELVRHIKKELNLLELPSITVLPRHVNSINQALESLRVAKEGLEYEIPDDVLVTALKDATYALGAISGKLVDDEILTRIFSGFCIGK